MTPIKFVSYNIQYSRGKDDQYDLDRIAEIIKGADIIALQEVTRSFPLAPDRDQPGRLGELLPEFYWVYGPPVDINASTKDDSGRVLNQRAQFGNMLLSRWPILASRLILLPRNRTYDQHSPQNGALEGIIETPAGPLRVYSAHLNHLSSAERMNQVNYLLPVMVDHARDGGAFTGPMWGGQREIPMPEDFILMGDHNLAPDSAEYIALTGEPDYYYGAMIKARHVVDTWVQSGHAVDEGITWYDEAQDYKTGLRLDYGFVSAGLANRVTKAWIDNDAICSDHQPVWFELSL
jgi:endonuclease/exonuclease/phosphatase family metal-dependent hydrolase